MMSGLAGPVSVLPLTGRDVIHVVAYDWNGQPSYQRFHTFESARGDLAWEGDELLEPNAEYERRSPDTNTAAIGMNDNDVPHASCDVPCSVSVGAALAIDANDVPHVLYIVFEKHKGTYRPTLR
jgi:hypothetical protein